MNKSRRMVAVQSRALAQAGFDVLQIDLAGCGDSEGDFVDASWQAWLTDVQLAYNWLRERSSGPLTLWGLRLGCPLAAEAAMHLPEPANFLFWQPVSSGKQHWQQFVRLKLASELVGGSGKEAISGIEKQLASGLPVEIAGYTISAELADAIMQVELQPPPRPAQLTWLEVSQREQAELLPLSRQQIEKWTAAGFAVDAAVVPGPSFWQTAEIEEVPALLAATLKAMEHCR